MFNFWDLVMQGYSILSEATESSDTFIIPTHKYVVELENEIVIDHPNFARLVIHTKNRTLTIGSEKPIGYLYHAFSKYLTDVAETSSHIRITFSTEAILNLELKDGQLTINKKSEALLNRKLTNKENKT